MGQRIASPPATADSWLADQAAAALAGLLGPLHHISLPIELPQFSGPLSPSRRRLDWCPSRSGHENAGPSLQGHTRAGAAQMSNSR
jgi:hypothetical protein